MLLRDYWNSRFLEQHWHFLTHFFIDYLYEVFHRLLRSIKWGTIVLKKNQESVNETEKKLQKIVTLITYSLGNKERDFSMNTLSKITYAAVTQKPTSHENRIPSIIENNKWKTLKTKLETIIWMDNKSDLRETPK